MFFFFLFCLLIVGLVFWPRLVYPFVFRNTREFYTTHFLGWFSGLCKYHLAVWSNFILLHSSQEVSFSYQSCPVLYFFFVLVCCYSFVSNQFLLLQIWSSWCCCTALSKEIQFLSWGCSFLSQVQVV